jgi:hypothetical protein
VHRSPHVLVNGCRGGLDRGVGHRGDPGTSLPRAVPRWMNTPE